MSEQPRTATPEPATTRTDAQETEVESVFVSNYPPYSFWGKEYVSEVIKALNSAANAGSHSGTVFAYSVLSQTV